MKRELKDYDPELESDELWDLLGQSPPQIPSTDFSNRVLEQIKADPTQDSPLGSLPQQTTEAAANILIPSSNQVSWWKTKTSQKVILSLSAAAACLLVGFSFFSPTGTHSSQSHSLQGELGDNSQLSPAHNVSDNPVSRAHSGVTSENLEDSAIDDPFNDVLETELVLAMANDPSLYANEEISAILGF